jgi:hypothetical protein
MRFSDHIWIPFLAAALCFGVAQAQTQTQVQNGGGDQRVQPSTPVSPIETEQIPGESEAQQATSDSRSFSGAEEFTAGTRERLRSYFFPSFQVSEMADSNSPFTSGAHEFETMEALNGRLTLQKVGKDSQLAVDYVGGEQIYNHNSEYNTTSHQLGITQSYQGRRWGFLLDDRATYLPESAFGYGGFGWMGALGPSLGGAFGSILASLNPAFDPNAGLLTGRGSRISNAAVAQIQYAAGPHSSITVTGSYELLHFRTPGYIDTRNAFFLAAYSRSLTPRDYFGINYGFGLFRYPEVGESFQTNFLELSYGHRITGRLALEVGGGPQVNVFKNPLTGSSTPVTWTANASLDYRVHRGAVGLSYYRYTASGDGLLPGADTHLVRVAWSMQLTRNWSGSLGPGYAHSRSLSQTTSGENGYAYDSVYAGASLSRSLGRYTTMFLTYNLQTQSSTAASCPASICGTSLPRHLVEIGFDWHPRQITID